ncbi:diguanylate cyclase [Saccharophagus degradans]|uniref:diguanylate cyclase n=1 Tax=Saccharophagus degradans TaxID=86304 RepID=UPI001C097477|nr:diguanylate cyclase [Saccharophagus degradans]MBU2986480.1 diguanylate cyclase [Saccharophagus degradans]
MKILLVEDSATLRHAMSHFVRTAGHEPVIAKSGEEALQIIEQTAVDLIIMDVEMPGLDGFETTRLIREWLGDHWIPIIFVTGMSEDESLEEGIDAGGDDYLVKPVSQMIISAKIRAMERITDMRNQLATLNRELKVLSQRDGLTHLYNRRTFEELAEKQWKIATRNKAPLAVLLLDIDHFKQYNDYYGHQQGDRCIQTISSVLAKCVTRPDDLIGRYGGEEFIILLPNTPEHGAHYIAEQIRKSVERLQIKHRASPSNTYVTVSIGGAALNYTTGTTWAHQVGLADKALYTAKASGRNTSTIQSADPHGLILVVDDDDASLSLISDILKGHCSIITAKSSEECMELAQELQPDLILMDAYLPGVNGYETCKSLTSNLETEEIPIILTCQADSLSEVEEFAAKAGAKTALLKPLDKHKLIDKIGRFISPNSLSLP